MGTFNPILFLFICHWEVPRSILLGKDKRGYLALPSLYLEIHIPQKSPLLCPKIFSLLPENEIDFTQKEGTLSAKKGPNST